MHDLNPDALRMAVRAYVRTFMPSESTTDHAVARLGEIHDAPLEAAISAYLAAMAERVLPDILKWLPAEFTLKVEADRGDWVVITSPEHPGLYVATPRTDAVGAFSDVPVVLSHLIRLDAAAKEAPHD